MPKKYLSVVFILGSFIFFTSAYAGTDIKASHKDAPASAQTICTDWISQEAIVGANGEHILIHPTYPPECNSQKDECSSSAYLLPNDVVTLRTQCGLWSYVEYTSPKLQHSVGWISSKSVPRSTLVPRKAIQNMREETALMVNSNLSIYRKKLDLCNLVADFENRGVLNRFNVGEGQWKSADELATEFGEDTGYVENGEYWKLDLNGDGIEDQVAILTQGTAHIAVGLIKPGQKNSVAQEISGDFEDLSLIKLGNSYYFASYINGKLLQIFQLTKAGEVESSCSFRQSEKPGLHIILGKERSVCLKAATGEVNYFNFTNNMPLSTLSDDPRFNDDSQHSIAVGATTADIENRGHPEPIVLIYGSSGGGRGCDSESLAASNALGNDIPDNNINHLLINELGEILTCGTKMKVFKFSEKNYIDASRENGDRSIFAIQDGKLGTICKYRGQFNIEPSSEK